MHETRNTTHIKCNKEETHPMKVLHYLKKYWYRYVFALLCIFITVSLDMLYPQITKSIIDDVITKGNTNLLTKLLLAILAIGVGRCVFGYLKEITFDSVSSKIGLDIRSRLFNHIQSLSVSFFDKNNTGELMSRVKDDVDRIWGAFSYVSMLILEVIIHTTIILICMFQLNHKLFIIPIIAMPLVAFLAILMEKKLGGIYEDISEENATLNTIAQENLAGVRTVKAFAKEKYEIKKFLSHNQKYYDLNMRQSKALIKYQPLFQFISKLLPILVLIYGGYLTIIGEISLGTLAAFIEYSSNITWPMEMLGWLTNDAAAAVASNKKINKILKEQPEIQERIDPITLGNVTGSIRFDHVSFTLEDKQILRDISFSLPAGKTIGIMGATGAGKTSIVNLMQRFYDVTDGSISLDGVNINELTLNELRKSVSLVMQDVFLFSESITDNVKLGMKNVLEEKSVKTALNDASASDFIEQMEDQYETIIGERGVGLSGGQKQRISIARALAKKAPILILDDSTSALDMETEHLIQETLNSLTDTTKVIIAHRISAVRYADEIIILENGAIAERGTHYELLAKKGLYYKTYMAQYGEYLEASDYKAAYCK